MGRSYSGRRCDWPTLDDLRHSVLGQTEVAANQTVADAFAVHLEHALRLLSDDRVPTGRPSLVPLALVAASPDLTRSRMRSRSNVAMPAMIVHIGLPVDVARSNPRPCFRSWGQQLRTRAHSTVVATAPAL